MSDNNPDVFVVLYGVDHEGSNLVGVRASLEAAQALAWENYKPFRPLKPDESARLDWTMKPESTSLRAEASTRWLARSGDITFYEIFQARVL